MTSGQQGDGPPGFDIPDLDLDVPARQPRSGTAPAAPNASPQPPASGPRAPAPAAPAPAAPGPADPADYFGSGMFEADAGGDSLELGTPGGSAAPSPGGAQDYFGAGTFDDDDDFDTFEHGASLDIADGIPGGGVAGVQIASGESWPTGRTPEPDAIRIDEVEVRLTADYGDAPSGYVTAPMYALRVFQRRRVLEPALRDARQEQEKAEAQRDEILADVVRSLRSTLEADDRMRQLLTPIAQLEQVIEERSAGLAGTNAEYDQRVQQLQSQEQQIRAQVDVKRKQEAELAAKVAEHEQVFRKADAMHKRIHIEIRAIQQAVQQRQQQGGAGATPAETQRLAELQANVPTAKAEADQKKAELDAVQRPLDAVRKELGTLDGQLRSLDAQRRQLDEAFQKQMGVRSEALESARKELRDALAEAARGLLATRGGIAVDDATLDRIRTADQEVARRATNTEKFFRAVDLYDREAVKRGYVAAGGIVGLLVLLIVVLILR